MLRHLSTLHFELLESLQQETAVVEVKLQVFSTASKSCNFIVSRVPTEAVNQSWKDTYDEKGGKKDWNCLGMHFCPENIRILCGGHAQQKKRNTLCSQPFSSDMVCFDAMQHSRVVSSSIPRASWWSASRWSCHILWARSSVYGYHRCHIWRHQQRWPEI